MNFFLRAIKPSYSSTRFTKKRKKKKKILTQAMEKEKNKEILQIRYYKGDEKLR